MNTLSTKELEGIGEQLYLEELLIKKFKSMADMTSDAVIKDKCYNIANVHKGHFDKLLSYLV